MADYVFVCDICVLVIICGGDGETLIRVLDINLVFQERMEISLRKYPISLFISIISILYAYYATEWQLS